MEEESIAKLLQIPRNLFINYRDPTIYMTDLFVVLGHSVNKGANERENFTTTY